MDDLDSDMDMIEEDGQPCIECGIAPGPYSIFVVTDNGELPQTPQQWVYCYDEGKAMGICDLCYRSGRTSKFNQHQLEYLKEMFDENSCDQKP